MHGFRGIGIAIMMSAVVTACGPDATEQAPGGTSPSISKASWPELQRFERADFARHVEILSSDEFEGRQPGTQGETKTIEYIAEQFASAGLEPATGDSYFQQVPLVRVHGQPGENLSFNFADRKLDLTFGDDIVTWSAQMQDHVTLDASELVFVGYGIVAPEYDWNDYANLDVRGKTVVILVNDPGYATQDDGLFKGNVMTYYGRWTYKYEEAARQGAAAALIVHNTGAAGYGWNVIQRMSRPRFYLDQNGAQQAGIAVQGWISEQAAQSLFSAAGDKFEDASEAAKKHGFHGHELAGSFTAAVHNSTSTLLSNNVIGVAAGTDRAHEAIVYVAHWDHLGKQTVQGGGIFNGAVDNATGVAAIIELAKAFTTRERPFKRSLVFIAATAEESGLLGSKFYASNPVFPLRDTVAAINIDSMVVSGPTHDIAVVGYGSSQLEDLAAPIAKRQGRSLRQEPSPEKGYFFRSDHINFARNGVPSFYAESGLDDREHGFDHGQMLANDYRTNDYHQVSDQFDPQWDMGAALEDIQLYYELGAGLADSDVFPQWYPGSEFRAAREASRAEPAAH